MDKLDLKEKILGGIFGVIAIISAIVEMFANGISISTVAGMMKDVFGTLIVVVLFVMVVKSLIPRKYKQSFEERLKSALDKWQQENKNMILEGYHIETDSKKYYNFDLRTNVKNFYQFVYEKADELTPDEQTDNKVKSGKKGWFVRLPAIEEQNYNKQNIEILFKLNRSTFFISKSWRSNDKVVYDGFAVLIPNFTHYINSNFSEFATAYQYDKESIIVKINNPIVTDEDINTLVNLIDTMYKAYLVAADMNINFKEKADSNEL